MARQGRAEQGMAAGRWGSRGAAGQGASLPPSHAARGREERTAGPGRCRFVGCWRSPKRARELLLRARGGCSAGAGRDGRAGQAPGRTAPSSALGRTPRPGARPRANFPPQGRRRPSGRVPPYLCCSPTSPSVITWGTSSSVGHTPEAMQPNTPHSSRMPSSSSSMAARGGGTRPGPLRRIPPARSYGRRTQPTAPRRAKPPVPCREACSFTCGGSSGLVPRPAPLHSPPPVPRPAAGTAGSRHWSRRGTGQRSLGGGRDGGARVGSVVLGGDWRAGSAAPPARPFRRALLTPAAGGPRALSFFPVP